MNVFLLTDIEGIHGVYTMDSINKANAEEYQTSCRHLEKTINFVCDECFRCGADSVYYFDGHAGGGNVLPENIDKRAVRVNTLQEWGELMKAGKLDCVMEIGRHARAGTIGGFLDHTISGMQIFRILCNGREMSESSLHALVAGRYNVPIVFFSGDDTACEQAKEEHGDDVIVAPVKHAEERNLSVERPDGWDNIRAGVAKALANLESFKPMRVDLPLVMEITYNRTDYCEAAIKRQIARGVKTLERIDARTLRKTVYELEYYSDIQF